MPRRFAPILALLAALAIGACNATPAAPVLTDPKEILTRSVLSLKDVKTLDAKGELTGTFSAQGTSMDLKGTTFDIAADIPGKKLKASASIPSLLNTSADVISVDQALYYRLLGPFAQMVHADPTGKYTKVDVPESSGSPGSVAADPLKAIDEFKAALDKLPSAPTLGANEKVGDQDCYHVTIKLTSDQLKALSPAQAGSLTVPFTVNVDVWARTNDLRPAKLVFGADGGTQGNVAVTLTMAYDTSVSIEAPSADQIAP
jgi:hypothetical protein